MKNITYNHDSKERLDKFLSQELADLSRSQIQKMIKAEEVLVNGKIAAVHHFLKNGYVVSFVKPKAAAPEVVEALKKTAAVKLPEPKIIAETADYLVLDKPAGLLVHPASSSTGKTLVDWLIKKYPKIKKVGENLERPGIVHRLDKSVSGAMVVAKNKKTYAHLKKQFQTRSVKKIYLGLVYGQVSADEGIIDFPLKRSRLSGKIVAMPRGEEGKESITAFTVIKKFANYTYLELDLKTGRSHQLRAHLTAYGYPLIGDQLYFNKKNKDKFKLGRVFLHAHKLTFTDLAGKKQTFTSKLPADLQNVLNGLS
ncbi:MAG: RluA family pseudouridine synthase [bacterium]|nr:RluA family pseudouridine synthase [bacterium]